ncbi:MAG: transglutaminase-like domain-containing protein [Candidatus Omnitrophota bacterium]|nr:transglutaminase-like domain-containing protein [Candidatus Omnitrophota bacterium]
MKRTFLALIIAGTAFTTIAYVSGAPEIGAFPESRQFQITYRAIVADIPQTAEKIRAWIPLASQSDGQTIYDRRISAPGPYTITRDPKFGNEMIYFEADGSESGPLEFSVEYRAKVDQEEFEQNAVGDQVELYLDPSRLMVINEDVRSRAATATANGSDTIEKARGIYDYVVANMAYDKVTPGWGNGDTQRACDLGKGNCTDFHSLFISMSQASEIPARFKIGFTVPKEPQGMMKGYHCWAEFYDAVRGWRPIDASDAWKHPELKDAYFAHFDTNKFHLSTGRDIELSPRQSGDPVNIFFYPHVEIDGEIHRDIDMAFDYKNP